MNKNSFFQNKNCEFFPCHKGIKFEDFNCMFCYCPLYVLGTECGGDYKMLPNGIKDCSECTVCHTANAHKVIESKFPLISIAEQKNRR